MFMKAFNKLNGSIKLEIKSLMPEKFINLLWKNGAQIKNVRKIDITTMELEMSLKDYYMVDKISKKTNTKIKVIGRKGSAFIWVRYRRRTALLLGVLVFAGILYYLSTFIWGIEITGDKLLSPYEIRQQLTGLGIKAGIKKSSINVYELEEKLMSGNESIMWVRVRMEGSKLNIAAAERQSPPEITENNMPCSLTAARDGEVVRIYAKAGEAVVKPGDIVKKGQLLVKGETVHAQGTVIARTFYEKIKDVSLTEVKRERTGNKVSSVYLNIGGRKLYLKKCTNPYQKYDKIEDNKSFATIITYYEVKETTITRDQKQLVEATVNEIYESIKEELKPSVQIVDKITDVKNGDLTEVRVLVVAEEDIASEEN